MKHSSSGIVPQSFFRMLLIAVALVAGTLVVPAGAGAEDDVTAAWGLVPGQAAIVADGPLNVRSGPGTGYGVLEVIPTGAWVEIVSGPVSANGYQWFEIVVDASGTDGYVAGVFLSAVSGSGLSVGDTVFVDAGALNVRSGPGLGYSVIDTMVYGQNGLIVDGPVYLNGYTWFELTYVGGASDGWVAGEFLALVSSGGGLAIGDMVSVSSGPLNVRSGPGTGYSIIDSMATGQNGLIVDGPVSANGYTWYKLDYVGGAVDGWVAGEYLDYAGGGGISVGDTVYVTAGVLNVRSGPGTGYSVFDSMVYGQNGLVVDGPVSANGYTWYKLDYVGGSKDGWVAGEYLGLV